MNNLFLVLLLSVTWPVLGEESSLEETMLSLDGGLFASFNQCQDPKELENHSNYFSPDVEFYHDNGGVTWDREAMILNTKNNACGHFTRQLVEGSFKAHPIKDFGAITQGVHIFCQTQNQQCEGKADFVMVWQHINNDWKVTRVLSYGHREND